ncbi:MAG: YIP1 family protein [Chthoniobacterales bacterium]
MKIHLNRAGQALGQFSPEEVRSGYDSGRFTPTDLAWCDGMPMWKPLSEVIDELAPAGLAASESSPLVPPAVPGGPAWENRAELGFFAALIETIRVVLLEPSKTFSGMKQTGGLGGPLFFYVLTGTIGGLAGIVYQTMLSAAQGSAATEGNPLGAIMTSTFAIGAAIMLLPILLAASSFVSSGLIHLSLMIVGGARRPFEATFRVACYAGGATAVLQLLPGCGAIVAMVWNFVLLIVGLADVHGIGKGRAAVAVLLPSVVCCLIVLLLAGVAAASLGGVSAFLEQAAKQAP